MSGISTAYSAIISKIDTVFASKSRLHNPYELMDNPEIIMRDAYGLKVGEAVREDMEYCNLTLIRSFTVIFLRQFATVGNKETAFDSISMALMEDQQTLMNHIHSKSELGIPDTVNISNIATAGGIDFLQTDQKKYLFCECTFTITTSEPVI